MTEITAYLSPNGQNMSRSDGPVTRILVATVEGVVTLRRPAPGAPWALEGRSLAELHIGSLLFEPGSGKLFACRHCYDLAYESTREHWGYRALRKAQKIRERLGADTSLDGFPPDKPKGMHWRTYERLMVELKAAEGTTNSYVLDWLSRLRAR